MHWWPQNSDCFPILIYTEEKGARKSASFLGNAAQTLQSFDQVVPVPEGKGEGDLPLDMTEDELAMFTDKKPLVAGEDNIVVRYSAPGATNPVSQEDEQPPPEPGYATVSELKASKKKKEKEKKMGQKVAKSLQNAMKPGKGGKKAQQDKRLQGLKPHQLGANPLAKLGSSVPPTPPPTPATAVSIAPSDEGTYIIL